MVNPNPVRSTEKLTGFFAWFAPTPTCNQFAVQSPDAHTMFKFGDVNNIVVRVKEKGVRSEQVSPFGQIVAFKVKNLNSPVFTVANPNSVVSVNPNTMWKIKLTWTAALLTP